MSTTILWPQQLSSYYPLTLEQVQVWESTWDEIDSASNFEASSPMPPNGALTGEVHDLIHPTVLKQIATVTINPSNNWQVSFSQCTGTAYTMRNFIFRYKLSLLQSFYFNRIPIFNLLEHEFHLYSYPNMVSTRFTHAMVPERVTDCTGKISNIAIMQILTNSEHVHQPASM